MSQLDFEKQFQEGLKERKLEPSEGSWEKLQERLDGKTKKRRPFFWWSGLAASIVGGILILSLVFQNSEVIAPPAIVDTASEEIGQEADKQQPLVSSEPDEENEENSVPMESVSKAGVESEGNNNHTMLASTREKVKEEEVPVDVLQVPKERSLAETGSEELGETPTSTSFKNITDAEVEALLADAMEQLHKDQAIPSDFTDQDVEALLAEATDQLNKEYGMIASEESAADNLLQEVERELEHSFREKVFEVLKESFQKTRTAIANRNN